MMVGNQYKIVSELGSGGMGIVYQAVDIVLEREVAIKKLRSEFSRTPDVAKRFLREAKIQARLNHQNITHLFTCLQEGEVFYIVMEFVAGTPLNKLIPLPYQRLLPLAMQILDSLEYAHGMGVLHRDIKPDNVMVTPNGTVKIMDFGIAHVLGSTRHTREKVIMGTLEYISPERITGKDPERSSDIYSLGAVLFEALAGRLPFESQSEFELLRKHLEAPPPKLRSLVPDCPEALEAVIDKALAKNPADRFANCREMADALAGEVAKLPARRSGTGPHSINIGEELERCRSRISALIKSGDTELAERVLDSARIDYAGRPELTELQAFVAQKRRRAEPGSGDQRRRIAEILEQVASLHSKGHVKAAGELALRARGEFPNVRAFQIAAICCKAQSVN
jgi:serine/threonine protein kinase